MIVYRELRELLDRTIGWEKQLDDLYDVAELGLRKPESKNVVKFLKERQESTLEILTGIDVGDFGPAEWVKFVRGYADAEILPKKVLNRESAPKEIFATILAYEENLKGFYQGIADAVVSDRQKELFDSLVRFKQEQISRITNYMKAQM